MVRKHQVQIRSKERLGNVCGPQLNPHSRMATNRIDTTPVRCGLRLALIEVSRKASCIHEPRRLLAPDSKCRHRESRTASALCCLLRSHPEELSAAAQRNLCRSVFRHQKKEGVHATKPRFLSSSIAFTRAASLRSQLPGSRSLAKRIVLT